MDIATKCQTHNAERLIDANVLKAKVFTSSSKAMNAQAKTACINMIDKAPTIEVVRCKDCKHRYYADNRVPHERTWVCERFSNEEITDNDFCSYGERSE